jgi:8-amino-7-oxononanoate synthase
VLDFTRASYLGFQHPAESLEPWIRITEGRPAALAGPPGARELAAGMAALTGCEAGSLGSSTLHLFFDFFGMWKPGEVAIWIDAGSYPIARWGAERARARGVALATFSLHALDALVTQLQRYARAGPPPLIVTDGWSVDRGPAPARRLLELARGYHGWLAVDDTQALGVVGPRGAGVLAAAGVAGPQAIVAASLAKGFGAPLAALCASRALIRRFEDASETRTHCTPPSAAAIAAGRRALTLNQSRGDESRRKLRGLLRRFRDGLSRLGIAARGGLFPVQSIELDRAASLRLYRRLQRRGVHTVLRKDPGTGGPLVTFLITALHREEDIDRALCAMREAMHVPVQRAAIRNSAFPV